MERTDTHNTKAPLSSEALGDFLHQLRRLVLDETASVRQQIFQAWSKPVPARVADGLAIEGVRVVSVEPDGTIELACDRNASRFREGDVLLLNRGNPFDAPNLLVTLELDDETNLLVSSEDPDVNWGTVLSSAAGGCSIRASLTSANSSSMRSINRVTRRLVASAYCRC
jgi:DNA replication ATP-dependent helicase Dna2